MGVLEEEAGVHFFGISGADLGPADLGGGLFGAGVGVVGEHLRAHEEGLGAVAAGAEEGGGVRTGGVGAVFALAVFLLGEGDVDRAGELGLGGILLPLRR